MPGEVGLLPAQACLLLVVSLGPLAEAALATPCPEGALRTISREEKKCCPECQADSEGGHRCLGVEDNDCKCHQGYSCADNLCLQCTKLPECAEGEELVKLGIIDFTFKCKPCERGTYSNVKNSWCRSWTDCESAGFLTIKPGNSTHNAVCGFPAKDLMEVLNIGESWYPTILAVLAAVAVFVLIQLTLFLHFCLWSLKREKHHGVDSLEYTLPRPSHGSHHKEETYSCQFPEEEHGCKAFEEKPCYFYPQSLQ